MNNCMTSKRINVNIESTKYLITPNTLLNEFPITEKISSLVINTRMQIKNILDGKDNRKILVVGPCSVHDYDLACYYGIRLKKIADRVKDKILIIMRVYFEKPRSTIGWKGMINDPDLNNSFNVNKGLRLARKLLLFLNGIGLPCGYEILDTFTPQFIGDLFSWGAIGARTTESQVHRQMVSGVSMPVGFKNSSSGDYEISINSIISANYKHCFYGIDFDGKAIILTTKGNKNCHIILRGSKCATNYDLRTVNKVKKEMIQQNIRPNIMIDCSHGNSNKDYRNQPIVFQYILNVLKKDHSFIMGIMLESNINEGKQKLIFGSKEKLKQGVSITDSCIDIEKTQMLINDLYFVLKKSTK